MKEKLVEQLGIDCAMRIKSARDGGAEDAFIRAGLLSEDFTEGMVSAGFEMADTVRKSEAGQQHGE